MSIYLEISENVRTGKMKAVKELVQSAVDSDLPACDILNLGLLVGMNEIGERFKNNEVYVPEVLVAARAMKLAKKLVNKKERKIKCRRTFSIPTLRVR